MNEGKERKWEKKKIKENEKRKGKKRKERGKEGRKRKMGIEKIGEYDVLGQKLLEVEHDTDSVGD